MLYVADTVDRTIKLYSTVRYTRRLPMIGRIMGFMEMSVAGTLQVEQVEVNEQTDKWSCGYHIVIIADKLCRGTSPEIDPNNISLYVGLVKTMVEH